jgi:hypothetical protein
MQGSHDLNKEKIKQVGAAFKVLKSIEDIPTSKQIDVSKHCFL